mmetsp:Transcript_20675/g.31614  ORF Transcript_20675/g.31614 Transcript_20675/m.31614 type:complete len:208 (+) Transcript_20675:1-624(+)
MPPSYNELSQIRSEDRSKHKADHDADCAYDEEDDANHALNFHLNRNNLQTPASDIFILPDDSDDDLSEDFSLEVVEDNNDEESVMSIVSKGQKGESEDIRTWKEYKKYSLREHFFEQIQEIKDSDDIFRDHFHDRDMKAIFSSGYSIRDLEKQQMKQSKKMRSCLKGYVPNLKFRRHGGWNKDESLKLGLNVMPVDDLLRNINDETE